MNHIQTKTIPSEAARQPMIQAQQDEAAIFVLSENGTILEANPEGMQLLGDAQSQFHPEKHHIASIIPKLATTDLFKKDEERVNPYLRFLSRIGHKFEIITANGKQSSCELYFNDIKSDGQYRILIRIYPVHTNEAF